MTIYKNIEMIIKGYKSGITVLRDIMKIIWKNITW